MGSNAATPRILLVGGGTFQLDIARAARQFGQVVVVDGSALAPALALADHARLADITDTDSVVQVARDLSVTHVVAAANDAAIPAVSAVVDALQLCGMSRAVATRCRDKLNCVRALERAHQPVPKTRLAENYAAAKTAASEVGGYPVVVKPRLGDGGQGVSVVHTQAELGEALAYAQRAYGPGAHAVLIQEYIGGRSVGVEAFFARGQLLQGFVMDDHFETEFVSPAGHALPSTLATDTVREILREVSALAHTLGLHDGPANFDLRYEGGTTHLIEVNPRLGGNGITELVRAAHGVELAEASVRLALGIPPQPALTPRHTRAAATRMILKRGRGLARYDGDQVPWRNHPDVLALEMLVHDGQPAHIRVGAWALLGRTLVRSDDGQAAAQLAERVATDVAREISLSSA